MFRRSKTFSTRLSAAIKNKDTRAAATLIASNINVANESHLPLKSNSAAQSGETSAIEYQAGLDQPAVTDDSTFALAFDLDGVLVGITADEMIALSALPQINQTNPADGDLEPEGNTAPARTEVSQSPIPKSTPSSDVHPQANAVLSHLRNHDVDFMFLTNSGGSHEVSRVKGLTEKFGLEIRLDQFVQSHTPFKDLVAQYADKTVLVIGGVGNACREVAQAYGFNSVITSADVIVANPHFWPFNQINPSYYQSFAQPLPAPITPADPKNSLQVAAIFVFNSSRDWGLDAQLCLDLLLSDSGILGTQSPLNGRIDLPNHGYQQQPNSCKLFGANPDFVWKTQYQHGSRFGQGAWLRGLEGIFAEATQEKAKLERTMIGKPYHASFQYGENVLLAKRAAHEDPVARARKLGRVYMVGDNPESDIRGARDFSGRSLNATTWHSILVETGVHVAGTAPRVQPTVVVRDVKAAVNWVMRQEGLPEMD